MNNSYYECTLILAFYRLKDFHLLIYVVFKIHNNMNSFMKKSYCIMHAKSFLDKRSRAKLVFPSHTVVGARRGKGPPEAAVAGVPMSPLTTTLEPSWRLLFTGKA